MNRVFQFALIGVSLALMLTQFNNCGNYAQPYAGAVGSSSVSCITPNCITPDATSIKITPHISGGQFSVTAALSEFNIGGDCNEGGFSDNTVHWDLMLNGVSVRNSGMPVAGNFAAESKCVNGRFLIYVNLGAISATYDQINRTGLADGSGGRSAYNLKISIYGKSVVNGQSIPTSAAVALVPLVAI